MKGDMYSLGGFPGVVDGEGDVDGEVYRINDGHLDPLDRLEGHPTFYRRESRPVYLTPAVVQPFDTPVECFTYIYQRPVEQRERINHGDWRQYCDEKNRTRKRQEGYHGA